MARRPLTMFVAVTLAIAVDLRAPESSAQDTGTSTAPAARSQTKSSASTRPKTQDSRKSATASEPDKKYKTQQATFGAGCFWHVEDVFEHLKGVNWAVSGYAGGAVPHPSYEMVHEGFTGHAEVVMVDYDPEVISYEDLLNVFWKIHDPTSINRQGEDEGPQYRSVIFYHNEEQRRAALKSYRTLTELGVYRLPIVTQLLPLKAFYRAEDYHQDYYGGKPRTSTRRNATSTKVKASRKKQTKKSMATAKTSIDNATKSAPPKSPAAEPAPASTP